MLKLKIPDHTIQVKFADGFDLSQLLAWLLPADRASPALATIEADFEAALMGLDVGILAWCRNITLSHRRYRVVKRGPGAGLGTRRGLVMNDPPVIETTTPKGCRYPLRPIPVKVWQDATVGLPPTQPPPP